MNEEYSFDIECPHCQKNNTIKLHKTNKCKHCDKPLGGEKYTKQIISVMSAIIIGGVSGVIIDGYAHVYRASVKTEYKMMKTCIDERSDGDTYHDKKIRDQCACAVEQLSGVLDAERVRIYGEYKLSMMLDEAYQNCK
jgi:hypothetical protein